MNTPNLTPDPGAYDRDAAVAFNAVTHAVTDRGEFMRLSTRSVIAAAVVRALDLPARDARVRAATAREVAEDIAAAIESHDPTAIQAARMARWHATQYDAPAEIVAAGSVVSTEGSGHPQPATDRWADTGCESCRCGSCAGHPFAEVYPDRPVLSLDTPEGDTDPADRPECAAPILLAAGAVDALRDVADWIDRGPTFPLPPSVISALIRECADDIAEGADRG